MLVRDTVATRFVYNQLCETPVPVEDDIRANYYTNILGIYIIAYGNYVRSSATVIITDGTRN